jgi:predicted nuclease of predicted toxin-antitoxin system
VRLKLDENFPARLVELFRQHGHEVESVLSQPLSGRPDADLAAVCREERRGLVTLDLDFCDVRRFPPQDHAGIAVLRPGASVSIASIEPLVRQFLAAGAKSPFDGEFWIVEPGRIRVRQRL